MATVDRTGHGGPTRRTAVELAAYAAYGPLVVTWLRTAPETREGGAGIRRGRLVLGVVLGTIVVVALASNDPGEPGALLVWLRWAPCCSWPCSCWWRGPPAHRGTAHLTDYPHGVSDGDMTEETT